MEYGLTLLRRDSAVPAQKLPRLRALAAALPKKGVNHVS
jgi:hypothetical protein